MEIKTPFDIINQLGKPAFSEISNLDKKRHFFIINRMLSRALPDISTNLGHQSIIPEIGVDYWNIAFTELGTTQKGRNILNGIRKVMYVSMSAAKKKEKVKIDVDLSKKFMEMTKMSTKEFNLLLQFFEIETIKYLKEVEKIIKTTK